MSSSPGDIGEAMWCKGWRMSRATSVASATSHLKWAEPLLSLQLHHTSNEQSHFRRFSYIAPQMSRATSVTSATSHLKWAEPLPSLQLHHTSNEQSHFRRFSYIIPQFSNPSFALPISQLILLPFVASLTSQLFLQPFFHFSYITGSSLTSPGKLPMYHTAINYAARQLVEY